MLAGISHAEFGAIIDEKMSAYRDPILESRAAG